MRLDGLNWNLLNHWIKKSEDEEEYVDKFISVWIAFNHYYATYYVDVKYEEIEQRRAENKKISIPDKAGIFLLTENPIVQNTYQKINEQLKINITLPVVDDITGKKVPEDKADEMELASLTINEFLDVIYQIRNNLFHGRKDPGKSERDRILCEIAFKGLHLVVLT